MAELLITIYKPITIMLQVTVIGNLGADARVENVNGSSFVSFNVAHRESYVDRSGVKHESTVWVSCALNGDGGNLLQHLTKGKLVYVRGRLSLRVYSSPLQRQLVAGANCSVDRIELLGGRVDDVPSRVYDDSGVAHDVHKAYFISKEEVSELGVSEDNSVVLRSESGRPFSLNVSGFIVPAE